jgi:hypothetical protein
MIYTHTEEIEFENGDDYYCKDVIFSGEPTNMEVGEDAGEFWGFKYASTIQIVRGCEDIKWDKSLYNEAENEKINKYLDLHFEHIEKEICGNE